MSTRRRIGHLRGQRWNRKTLGAVAASARCQGVEKAECFYCKLRKRRKEGKKSEDITVPSSY